MFAPRRLCVAVDLAGFSTRRPEAQSALQHRLRRTLRRVWRENGCARPARVWQGDGEVALAPPKVDESAFVSGFTRSLRIALRRANSGFPASSSARMRVRVAMHTGAAAVGRPGLVGTGVVRACRLLDAEPLRAALAEQPGADLALIVSQSLFEDVIWAERHELIREDFSAVRIVLDPKSFVADAWVHVAASRPAVDVPPPADLVQLLVTALTAREQPEGRQPSTTVATGSAGAGSSARVASQYHLLGESTDSVAR